ncbi:MAG: hypothetical protein IKP50_00310 [Bacilli bacterium]|nr:hypothetical protein [Bacilli bacterium]
MPKVRILFTQEQDIWLYSQSRAKKWKSIADFTNAFNKAFGVSKSPDAIANHMRRQNMPKVDCLTTDFNKAWSKEYREWIENNLNTGVFKDKKHFLKVFNAVFNETKTLNALTQYMKKNNLTLSTPYNLARYTEEQEEWIKENCSKYEVFAEFVKDFNLKFGTSKSHSGLTSKCESLGLRFSNPSRRRNSGNFKKGINYGIEECPIGTIRLNKQTNLYYIKVQLCNGIAPRENGHNYKEPYWKMLQNKIWEDNYGKIPDGYIACSLTNDPYEQNIENIALIDKRGKSVMGRKEWWSDNAKFTATGVQWCNLYFTAKDNGVLSDEK